MNYGCDRALDCPLYKKSFCTGEIGKDVIKEESRIRFYGIAVVRKGNPEEKLECARTIELTSVVDTNTRLTDVLNKLENIFR